MSILSDFENNKNKSPLVEVVQLTEGRLFFPLHSVESAEGLYTSVKHPTGVDADLFRRIRKSIAGCASLIDPDRSKISHLLT